MSKILFLTNWPYNTVYKEKYYGTHSFFEGFAKAFLDFGYDVLHISLLNFGTTDKLDNQEIDAENTNILLEKIRSYKPDLIIAFNNEITGSIYQITDCPVVIWSCDDLSYFDYCGNKYISQYKERLYFFFGNKIEQEYIQALYDIQPSKSDILKPSTSFYSQDIEQNKDITYVGGMYSVHPDHLSLDTIKTLHSNKASLEDALKRLFYNIDDPIGIEIIQRLLNKQDCKHDILCLCCYYQKTQVLAALSSYFDLHVYNSLKSHIKDVVLKTENLDLMLSYHIDEPCDSLQDVSKIYNSSKIGLNLSTAHTNRGENGGFSWRVTDMMATNACVVSSQSTALERHFSKWVKIPQFSNIQELYDISKKLLVEDNWRKDISTASQIAIKEGGFTFSARVKELEGLFALKPNLQRVGDYEFFVNEELGGVVKPKKRFKLKKLVGSAKKIINKLKK